jgi:hypothetical protein
VPAAQTIERQDGALSRHAGEISDPEAIQVGPTVLEVRAASKESDDEKTVRN